MQQAYSCLFLLLYAHYHIKFTKQIFAKGAKKYGGMIFTKKQAYLIHKLGVL